MNKNSGSLGRRKGPFTSRLSNAAPRPEWNEIIEELLETYEIKGWLSQATGGIINNKMQASSSNILLHDKLCYNLPS